MYKHILVATDGSKLSSKGVREAIKLAKALRAKVTAVHVVSSYRQMMTDPDSGFNIPMIPELKKNIEIRLAAHAKEILGPVKKAADAAGVQCNTVIAIGDFPYDMIIKQAKKSRCDLIVMASHGRSGLQGVILGSEANKVLSHSKIPVLVVR